MKGERNKSLEQKILDDHQRAVDFALAEIEKQNASKEAEEKDLESRGLFTRKKIVPNLAHNDEEKDKRRNWLESNREKYQYNHDYLPPFALLDTVPEEEKFSTSYKLKRGLKSARLFADLKLARLGKVLRPLTSIDSFEKLFTLLPNPTSINTWRTDVAFAEQRLSGVNPMKIRKITAASELPFKPGESSAKIPGFEITYGDALKQGRLFLTNYSDLSFIKGVPGTKYLPTPKSIFFWSTDHAHAISKQLMGHANFGQLLPIAIQVRQDGPVYTPAKADPIDWMMAKLCVQIADANHHEMGSHLCHTHLVMEPFAIATARQLAENHPVGILLRPHFKFLMVNNEAARTIMLRKGGPLDNIMAGTIEETLQLIVHEHKSWSLKDFSFHQHIKNRGMNDTDEMPDYAYRDDGTLVWNAINKFVSNYVKFYYKNNKDITEDTELLAWSDELASQEHGRVKGMPQQIKTRFELIEMLTFLLFTSSGQHSAVNYSQYDYMANIPNMPLAAYCPFETTTVNKTIQDVIKFLPSEEKALYQLELATVLTSFHYDRLGFYGKNDFSDETVHSFIKEFQQELEQVEHKINVKNTVREFPYKFLKPSEILNSISI